MKSNKSVSFIGRVLPAVAFCLLIATSAYAHFPWITPHDADADNPEKQTFELGWGHHFSDDANLSPDRVESMRLVEPDGNIRDISLEDGPVYGVKDLAPSGTYIIEAIQEGSYYSRTTRGGKRASREEYPNAVSCGFSNNTMKAIFSRGEGGDAGRILGHSLEIIPLEDPSTMTRGEKLPVKVMFRGEPFTGKVNATWKGFSDHDHFAHEKQAGADGIVEIPLENAGLWLIMVHVSEDYPDPEVCDDLNYNAVLTFRVDE